jgi:hypothetical protein
MGYEQIHLDGVRRDGIEIGTRILRVVESNFQDARFEFRKQSFCL